jgi:ADP-ribose pyrophosphatase
LTAVQQPSKAWRVVDSEIVIETPHLRLRRDHIELPDGTRVGDYYVRESRGFAVVFAVTPDERIVLVRQYKHGIGASVLELPAGGIDPGESPLACARRELAEETGYVGDPADPELLRTFILDPTSSTTRFHLFLARGARPLLEPNFDLTEDIEVELATFEELRRFVRDGTIEVGSQAAAIYHALDHLGRL